MPAVSVKRVLKLLSEVRDRAGESPSLCLVGEGEALSDVARALSEGAGDTRGGLSASFDVLPLDGFPRDPALAGRWGIVVVVAPAAAPAAAAPVAAAAGAAGAQVVVYAPRSGSPAAVARLLGGGVSPSDVAVSLGRPSDPGPTLAARLADAAGDGAPGLAARLPFLRRAVAEDLVLKGARQNALIGAVVFIPGADMPAMTANQIRMILRIAQAYDEELGFQRALEIISVVGAAFAMRTLARQSLTYVPGFGWALKGAVGFTGTIALGRAAIAYFEAGAPLTTTRVTKLARQFDRLKARLPGGLATG
ncbi:MAG: DUF697 domain-containing protein [Thermoleophilia bacterium]|nr:DUF697 domain-containing protein [Thermoleophilia bacterium]